MCMIDMTDPCTTLFDDWVKARKAHKCCECRRLIQPKELYRKYTGVGSDGFYSAKTCQHCFPAQEILMEKCHGYIFGEVCSDLHDHIHEKWFGYREARLIVGMRRKWQRFDGNGLIPSLKTQGGGV